MKITRDIYRSAWRDLKKHYFINVVAAFIAALILNDGYVFATDWTHIDDRITSHSIFENRKTNAEVIKDFLEGQEIIDPEDPLAETTAEKYTMGYFSVIVNEVTSSGSLGFGILNGVNKIIFRGKISESVTIFVMVIFAALLWIFFKNIIIVGRCRYFLERRLYPETKPDKLLFVFRTGNLGNAAKVMLIRSVKQALWNITIVGGVIKHYEYMMIPYILAENPTVTAKEAFALSKRMMLNDKKNAFLLDLSMLPIMLIDGLTFQLVSLFFLDPYRECVFAELYASLRAEKKDGAPDGELLWDDALTISTGASAYPDENCPTPFSEHHLKLGTDYERDYGGLILILFFFCFALIGYVWEVFFYLINEGSFINRGTLTGPWLPIYGVGGFLILFVLKPLRKSPALMFAGSFVLCGAVEYATSWLLELIAGKRWWDYTGYFMNINGRVCLEGLLVFGLGGVALTYFIAPASYGVLHKIPVKVQKILCIVLVTLFAIDCVWSVFHPNTGNGITEGFY